MVVTLQEVKLYLKVDGDEKISSKISLTGRFLVTAEITNFVMA